MNYYLYFLFFQKVTSTQIFFSNYVYLKDMSINLKGIGKKSVCVGVKNFVNSRISKLPGRLN